MIYFDLFNVDLRCSMLFGFLYEIPISIGLYKKDWNVYFGRFCTYCMQKRSWKTMLKSLTLPVLHAKLHVNHFSNAEK